MPLKGKYIIVSGAAGNGIAKGICDTLETQGGHLIMLDKQEAALYKAAKRYTNARMIVGDLQDETLIQGLFSMAESEGLELVGLVNNAGTGLSKSADLVTEEEYKTLFDVDMKALWRLCKYFIRHHKKNKTTGNIVNLSSVHARSTISGYALYAGVKACVEAFTRGLALEIVPLGCRANAVAPGYVHSEQNMALLKTWTKTARSWVKEHTQNYQAIAQEVSAKDCGDAVAFLLSDASRSITGQTIVVDAGTSLMLYKKDFVSNL